MRHNFRYVKFFTPKGIGYATVSIDWEKERVTDSIYHLRYVAGVALCSPRDKLLKSLGRKIADGRRQFRGQEHVVTCGDCQYITDAEFRTLVPQLIADFVASDGSGPPRWVMEAVEADRFELGLRQTPTTVISLDEIFDRDFAREEEKESASNACTKTSLEVTV